MRVRTRRITLLANRKAGARRKTGEGATALLEERTVGGVIGTLADCVAVDLGRVHVAAG